MILLAVFVVAALFLLQGWLYETERKQILREAKQEREALIRKILALTRTEDPDRPTDNWEPPAPTNYVLSPTSDDYYE